MHRSNLIRSCGLLAVTLAISGCQAPGSSSLWNGPSSILPADSVRFQDEGPANQDPAAFRFRPGAAAESISPPDEGDPRAGQVVKEVIITGNEMIPDHQVMRRIRTRSGRYFDPDLLQEDVNRIWQMKGVRRVNGPLMDYQPDGIVVTFDISERPYMKRVLYVGNRAITDKQLATETGLAEGQPLDIHSVRMARTRIEDHYEEKGFPRTQVSIVAGDKIEDREVVFLIHEDELQRVSSVGFEGNEVASDSRLRSFIKMKPGVLWLFGGKVNRRELEQDQIRLTAYYRSLGYFNARIGRELSESENGRWLSVRYIINEGPRYRVRNVSFAGNDRYSSEELASVVKLRAADGQSPEFNAARMNEDVTRLRDLYGSQGYVFANVEASPEFLEEPGQLDLVYRIKEGSQYRVGNINVVINGEYGITRNQVVLNRLAGLRPGDLIDSRKLREAEIHLTRSQLFVDGVSTPGQPPSVTVVPPELEKLESTLQR